MQLFGFGFHSWQALKSKSCLCLHRQKDLERGSNYSEFQSPDFTENKTLVSHREGRQSIWVTQAEIFCSNCFVEEKKQYWGNKSYFRAFFLLYIVSDYRHVWKPLKRISYKNTKKKLGETLHCWPKLKSTAPAPSQILTVTTVAV